MKVWVVAEVDYDMYEVVVVALTERGARDAAKAIRGDKFVNGRHCAVMDYEVVER